MDAATPTAGILAQILATHGADIPAYYRAVRAAGGHAPVFWDAGLSAWIVTGYAACRRLLASDALSKARLRTADFGFPPTWNPALADVQALADRQMNFDDFPAARNAHRAWARHLRVEDGSAFALGLADLAGSLLAACPREQPFDFYGTVLRPYVSRAIACRLGLEESTRVALYGAIWQVASFLDGRCGTAPALGRAMLSLLGLADHVRTHGTALMDKLGMSGAEPERWIADYVLTLVAGHESTAYTLGIALLHTAGDNLCTRAGIQSF